MPAFSLTEQQLIAQFIEALRALPEVQVGKERVEALSSSGDRDCDARIDLYVAGKPFVLLVETKKSVYPRDARDVVWRFREAIRDLPKGAGNEPLSILLAESLSVGAKDLLKEEHVGYYDSGGSMHLPAAGAYVYIDKPPPKTLAKTVRSLFSGRRSQVLHTLLVQHKNWFGVKELAQRAIVSPATASQVLTELERFDWMTVRGQGPNKERQLREPTALLNAWAKQLASVPPPNILRYYVPAAHASTLLERVGEVFDLTEADYAFSYEAAAQRYSPFLSSVSQVRARVLIGEKANAAIGDLDARLVNEGANLAIIEVKSPGDLLFRQRVDDVWLASPVQVYLDLIRGEGRSKELAEHLRKTRISF